MKKIQSVLLLFATLLSSHAFASTFEVPAAQILEASRKIVHQTGPAYQVSGDLHCTVIVRDFPPYGGDTACKVKVQGSVSAFEPSQELLDTLMVHTPMKGPYYEVSFSFNGMSIAQEVPPYTVMQKVELTDKK